MATRTSPRETSLARRRRTSRPIGIQCVPALGALRPGERLRVRAVLTRPTRATLSYTWTTNAGQLVSRGAEARFDSTGMPGGVSVIVLVHVRHAEGRRGRARCRIDILPRLPAPGFTCTSGGFPANRSVISDVDLACLDDVSTRMHEWPRSRTLIVGHADRRERNPHVVGIERARAAARYMVNNRGVERARVSIASAGAARPLDRSRGVAARARNRRVDVTFQPQDGPPSRGAFPSEGGPVSPRQSSLTIAITGPMRASL